MMRSRKFAFLPAVLLAVALLARPAPAANPLVTVELEDARSPEVALALSKAAGVTVELFTAQYPKDVPLPKIPQLEERHTVSWRNIPFARALRQFCKLYGLAPNGRQGGGYVLYPSQNAAPAPKAKRVGLFSRNGSQIFVRGVSVNSNRSIRFADGGQDWDNTNLQLEVGGEVNEGDAAAIAGLQRVTAKDDTGNLLVSEQGQPFYGTNQGAYPDEWSGYLNLSGPHPHAKKLLWIEGDVMRFKVYRTHQIDIPTPLPPGPAASRTIGGVVLEALEYQPQSGAPAPAAGQDKAARAMTGARVQTRIFTPRGSEAATGGGFGGNTVPLLVTQGGKLISPQGTSAGGSGDENGTTYTITTTYPPTAEVIVALRYTLVEKGQPEKLFSFRMENVPLPGAGNFMARRKPMAPPQPQETPGTRAYFEKGGARMTTRVLLGEQPAGEGHLALGLSVKEGTEWSGVRWLEAPVDKMGAANLEDVKPGTYRVLRVYRAAQPPANAGSGRWENDEVTVTVTAGKQVALSPLRYTAQPVRAPGKKPAAAAPVKKTAGGNGTL